ncbi:hypothetical protein Agub_g3086, partial [Astrephomene gubernaculifera]
AGGEGVAAWEAGGMRPRAAWYCGGKSGVASRGREGMQLPYTFHSATQQEEPAPPPELPGAGRGLQVAFHLTPGPPPPPCRRAQAAAAALARLRGELREARTMQPLDLAALPHTHTHAAAPAAGPAPRGVQPPRPPAGGGGPAGFLLPSTSSSS